MQHPHSLIIIITPYLTVKYSINKQRKWLLFLLQLPMKQTLTVKFVQLAEEIEQHF